MLKATNPNHVIIFIKIFNKNYIIHMLNEARKKFNLNIF